MSSIDLLIVAAVVLAALTGVRSGFVATLYGLITWLVAIPVALVFQGPLGALLARSGLEAPLARTLAFIAVLLLIEIFFAVLGADQTQKLDLPDGLTLVPDPEAEQEMLTLVNNERTSRGLPPLVLDPRLVPVSRQHSEEMFRLKYFGHQSPVSGSPFDRLAAAKVTYTRAGENLAYAHSVILAHRGLMDSEGHRENILRPEFTRVGIGVVAAGSYGRMFTQLFVAP